ncbi:hypothetical protein FOMPIDRAFT_1055489 [Fomitopsis schrenkii]|uniref:Uncharacterized protein n=1 Tax=Fomitopsis schrenkii TaxID=2126942 RepID=S8DRZ3_FOMSC|nr:hypothetical protein FOMPIDRAFT_1055489 [Fomitopsis schrenkii]
MSPEIKHTSQSLLVYSVIKQSDRRKSWPSFMLPPFILSLGSFVTGLIATIQVQTAGNIFEALRKSEILYQQPLPVALVCSLVADAAYLLSHLRFLYTLTSSITSRHPLCRRSPPVPANGTLVIPTHLPSIDEQGGSSPLAGSEAMESDFEKALRTKIQDGLMYLVEGANAEKENKLEERGHDESEKSVIIQNHNSSMTSIRRIAHQQSTHT